MGYLFAIFVIPTIIFAFTFWNEEFDTRKEDEYAERWSH